MPNFQEFDRQDSHVVPDAPMFTLQTRGTLSLNLAAFKALGEPAAVVLLYDPEEGIIALRKVPRTHHNGYPVRKQGNSRSYLVAATGFASYHKIKTDVSRRYIGRDYGDQTWGFAVADGVVLKHRPRPPKASVHDIREGTGTHGGPANRQELWLPAHADAVECREVFRHALDGVLRIVGDLHARLHLHLIRSQI